MARSKEHAKYANDTRINNSGVNITQVSSPYLYIRSTLVTMNSSIPVSKQSKHLVNIIPIAEI